MKRATRLALVGTAFLAGLLVRGWLTPGNGARHDKPPPQADEQATEWTCSMHPQIRQPSPGKCPLCGMDLIPVVRERAGRDVGPRQLALSPAAQALAQIETAPVERRFVESEVRMVGKIAYDTTRTRDVVVLADGVIERLFVNYEGVRVRAGDHLAEFYSPDVLAAQKELIAARRVGGSPEAIAAARLKLALLGVAEDEIEDILRAGEARKTFLIRSPIDGVLTSMGGHQGHWLNRGEHLGKITDPSTVWAQLDAYESDLGFIHYGQKVELEVEALPGRRVVGHVSFIPPELNDMTRSVKVRLNVPNPDGALKPGMFVRAKLKVRQTAAGQEISPELAGKWISPMHPEIIKDGPGYCDVCGMALVPAAELGFLAPTAVTSAPPLVIPASAALLTGTRALVYVAVPDAPGVFEGREVELGPRAGNFYIVRSGLEEGEQVVTRGNMKIDSAIQLRGKPSMMNPATAPRVEPATTAPAAPAHADAFNAVLTAYDALTTALASDQLHPAHAAASRLKSDAEPFPELTALAESLGNAESLESARAAFEPLSRAVLAQARAHQEHLGAPVYVAFCPMAFDDKGAEWLQRSRDIRNPYFGEAMLHCGVIRETLGTGDTP